MNLQVITDAGYLANPYREIRYLDPTKTIGYTLANQVYPDTHTSTAVQVQAKYYLPYRAAVTGLYRYYTDTWGVVGNTYELDYTHPIANTWIFEGRVRYYKQSAASFYSDLFPFAFSQNFTARDQNLAALDNTTIGAKVTYAFLPDGWKVFKRGTVTADVSRIPLQLPRLSQHQGFWCCAGLRSGNRASVSIQRYGLSALFVDVFLTRTGFAAPPRKQHRSEGRGNGYRIRHPVPEIPVPVHHRQPLHYFDQSPERR